MSFTICESYLTPEVAVDVDFVPRSFGWSSLMWKRNHSKEMRTSDGRECSEIAWNTSSSWSKWLSSPRFRHWFKGRCYTWTLSSICTIRMSSCTCLLSEHTSAIRASAAIKNWFRSKWSVYSPGLIVESRDEVGSTVNDERMCLSAPQGRRRTVSDIKKWKTFSTTHACK